MDKQTKAKSSRITTRHYARVVAFVVLGISVGVLLTSLILGSRSDTRYASEEVQIETSEESESATTTLHARSAPVLLRIPKLGLSAEFEAPLRLNPDKSIEVPDSYEKVGWYEYGPTPGEIGPSVVLGHVDSKAGPAVFYSLGQLSEGDEVSIERVDGTTAVFVVEKLERYEQAEFPTEKVYGKTERAELRLITCSGTYDRGEQRYSHNLVVYAALKN